MHVLLYEAMRPTDNSTISVADALSKTFSTTTDYVSQRKIWEEGGW